MTDLDALKELALEAVRHADEHGIADATGCTEVIVDAMPTLISELRVARGVVESLGPADGFEYLRDWLAKVAEWRTDIERKAVLGKGPCPGGNEECRVTDCEIRDSDDDHDPYLSHYPYPEMDGVHDFDGGDCWRCRGRQPDFVMDRPEILAMNEPTIPMSEGTSRAILTAWDAYQACMTAQSSG